MSGHVLRFKGSAHSEAQRLLPWFVNATLEGEELARVVSHLAECTACQREADQLRALRSACADAAEAATLPDPHPALLRLQRRLHAPKTPTSWPRAIALRRAWTLTPGWMRGALTAQFALMLVLGAMLIGRDRPVAPYRTLGDAGVPTPGAASPDVPRLLIVFDPHLSQAQMQGLLRASQARIVDGPSDAGAYVLAVPAAREASVREALRAATGVTLVESLGPGERR